MRINDYDLKCLRREFNAAEPAKRYEIKPIESGMFRSYKITERNGDTFMANMTREKAQELCDKLNRLEELEAN